MTSPPYYGLRAYHSDPVVWGGDPEHQHQWTEHRQPAPNASGGHTDKQLTNAGSFTAAYQDRARYSRFCSCGAWLGQLGLEPTPEDYTQHLVEVFRGVRRVLRPDGCLFVVIGDTFYSGTKGNSGPLTPRQGRNAGSLATRRRDSGQLSPTRSGCSPDLKTKDLMGMPWRLAFALQADGWWLRSDIIWRKPNPMVSSTRDRPTCAHEYVFLLAPSERYYWDWYAVREPFADARQGRDGGVQGRERNRGGRQDGYTKPSGIDPSQNGGRNLHSVWTIAPEPCGWGLCQHCSLIYDAAEMRRLPREQPEVSKDGVRRRICHCGKSDGWLSHYAAYPSELVKTCLLAATSECGCCPECGAPYQRLVKEGGSSWVPTCPCPTADSVPATVLDPFSGTATTGLAALHLGHNYIGIDSSEQYNRLAAERLRRAGL